MPECISANPKKVLVVDGNDGLRAELIETIKELGFETVEANNGAKALELISSAEDFCLIVSDMALEEVRGYYMIQLLQNSSRYRGVPLIVNSETMSSDSLTLLQSLPKDTTRFITKAKLTTKIAFAIKELVNR